MTFQITDFNAQFNQPASGPDNLQVRQGVCFRYAIPAGWRVAEDGQFAVVLMAPDNSALTVMVGNSGYPINYPPHQFIYEKLMGMNPQGLQLGAPRPAQPLAGCSVAYEFDCAFWLSGQPYRGVAKCSITPAYNICTLVMSFAAAVEVQWPGYAAWLPTVASQVQATNGAAFGVSGIMAQNIEISRTEGEAFRNYREWSNNLWEGVRHDREQSQERQNFYRRENLGGVQTFTNPYDARPVELPLTYTHYWVNRQGIINGTNDPNFNPNVGGTADWVRMNRYQP